MVVIEERDCYSSFTAGEVWVDNDAPTVAYLLDQYSKPIPHRSDPKARIGFDLGWSKK
jgi:hypothetical protein